MWSSAMAIAHRSGKWEPSRIKKISPSRLRQRRRFFLTPAFDHQRRFQHTANSKLVGKNILQVNPQFHKDCFQFVQRQMMLTVLNAIKRLVGNAGLPGELSVGKLPAFLAQEFRQLPVQIALHAQRVTKTPSRMRDDLPLQ